MEEDIENIWSYHLLRAWRHKCAEKESMPPGFIVPNKVLEYIVRNPPESIEELYEVKGFGLQKLKKYANAILSILGVDTDQSRIDTFIEEKQKQKSNKKKKPRKRKNKMNDFFQKKQNIETPVNTDNSGTFEIPEIDISELSPSQKKIFDAYRNNENIFMTGPAGTGKSYLINKIVQDAIQHGKQVQCCALTGCAALLLECDAKTIHSWSGVGTLRETDNEIIQSLQIRKHKHLTWKSTDILIIDEISMMNARLFSLLNQIGQIIRKNIQPFGGIQVILSGDFYQLPPIHGKFCFESPDWDKVIHTSVLLRTIYRQSDPVFAKILNQIRTGRISRRTYNILNQCVERSKTATFTDITPTIILPKKKQTDRINQTHLDKLDTPEYVFTARVHKTCCGTQNISNKKQMSQQNTFVQYEIKNMFQSNMFEKNLTLKVGAQVMCISNLDMDNGICNGSIGTVIKISPNTSASVYVQFKKCKKWIHTHIWQSKVVEELSITQIPLILAWSCTIHKIQGATLDLVEVDVGNDIFECGQTYVALSRVKNLSGLFMQSFNPLKIKANKKVQRFYSKLEAFLV